MNRFFYTHILSIRTWIFVILLTACSMTCACNAVTPGPCTTRKMTAPTAATEVAEVESTVAETTTAAVVEVTTEAAETESETIPVEGTWMTANDGVNVRSGPGTDYDIVGSLAEGDDCLKIGSEGSWAKIMYEDEICYVSATYLDERED